MSGGLPIAGNRHEVYWSGEWTEDEPYVIHLRVWSETYGFDVTYALPTMVAHDLAADLAGHSVMSSEHIAHSARRGVS